MRQKTKNYQNQEPTDKKIKFFSQFLSHLPRWVHLVQKTRAKNSHAWAPLRFWCSMQVLMLGVRHWCFSLYCNVTTLAVQVLTWRTWTWSNWYEDAGAQCSTTRTLLLLVSRLSTSVADPGCLAWIPDSGSLFFILDQKQQQKREVLKKIVVLPFL